MREWFVRNIKGDRTVWAIIGMFTLCSFLAIYSASTNLVYVIGKGTSFGYLLRHSVYITLGFFTLYTIPFLPSDLEIRLNSLGADAHFCDHPRYYHRGG